MATAASDPHFLSRPSSRPSSQPAGDPDSQPQTQPQASSTSTSTSTSKSTPNPTSDSISAETSNQSQPQPPPPESSTQSSTLPSIPPPVFSAPSSPRPDVVASPTSPASPSPASPTRPSRGASTSSSVASFNLSGSGLLNRTFSGTAKRSIRRQSTQERLDEILETARNRAENYAASSSTQNAQNATSTLSTNRRATFRMEPLLRNQSAPGAFAGIAEQYESESADETTGIRGNRRGQTTSTYGSVSTPASTSATRSSSGPRARKPADRQEANNGGANNGSRAASIRSQRAGGAAAPPPSNRWRDFWAGFQSIELENKGSVARDHLALERTFLAWLRTSLAFASIGIAVTQLFRLNTSNNNSGNDSKFDPMRHVGRPLGTTFLGISVLVLFLGYHRYYQSQQWILKGKFPASRGTILIVSLVAFALMVTSLVVVVVVQPNN